MTAVEDPEEPSQCHGRTAGPAVQDEADAGDQDERQAVEEVNEIQLGLKKGRFTKEEAPNDQFFPGHGASGTMHARAQLGGSEGFTI